MATRKQREIMLHVLKISRHQTTVAHRQERNSESRPSRRNFISAMRPVRCKHPAKTARGSFSAQAA
jgi:hypothetical protein